MKLIYILAVCFLVSFCGNDRDDCVNMGTLCEEYPENYYKCTYYDYYYNQPPHDYTCVYVYYKIMDDEWTTWYSYEAMWKYYCTPKQIEEEPEMVVE